MPCEHVGPVELIEMAEGKLRERGVDEAQWPGAIFRWSENVTGGTWASVILEVERRGEQWTVIRIERLPQPLPEGETGLRRVSGLVD
jgi:hypothetical protein